MLFNFTFGLAVQLSSTVEKLIRDIILQYDFHLESGGILVGRIEPLRSLFTITDITYPQSRDSRLPLRFFRREEGHQEIMDTLWENSGYEKMYLGEWHTHNTSTPTPSIKDLHEWKRCVEKKKNTPNVLFLIVGTKAARLWTIRRTSVYTANEALI